MNECVVKELIGQKNLVIFEKKMAIKLGVEKKKHAYLSYGNKRQIVHVLIEDKVQNDEILVTSDIVAKLRLPTFVKYDFQIIGNELRLGPSIGILAASKEANKMRRTLRSATSYLDYQKLLGTIIIFTLEGIDKEQKLINGYCYNPIDKTWVQGNYPYPRAIYRRIGIGRKWKQHFLEEIGDNLFNNYFLNKWKFYQFYSSDKFLAEFIPQTILFNSYEDILKMLDIYQRIYIKPISGMRGKGIICGAYEEGVIQFYQRVKGQNQMVTIKDIDDLKRYCQNLKEKRYLIQQPIDLIKYDGSIVDFRCVVQKDDTNTWKCNGIIGRIGEKGSIVSNISSGGRAEPGGVILAKVLNDKSQQPDLVKENISLLALKAANFLDQLGINCGDLGIDIGIDNLGKLWLIEINSRDPDATIALDVKDRLLYYKLKNNPLLYAKYLSGFGRKK